MLPICDFVAAIYQTHTGVEDIYKQQERLALYYAYEANAELSMPSSDNIMIAALSYAAYNTLLTGDNVVFVTRDAYHSAALNVILGRSVGRPHTLTALTINQVNNSALRGRTMTKIFVPRDFTSTELMNAIATNGGVTVYKY